MIDIAQVQGQVHAQSVQKVGELADKNPNETVSIIRQWLHETRQPDRTSHGNARKTQADSRNATSRASSPRSPAARRSDRHAAAS